MGGKRWLVLGVMGGTLIVSVIALFHATASTSDNPTVDDWRAAASLIHSQLEPGDGIRVEPVWRRDGAAHVVPMDQNNGELSGMVDLSIPADPMFVARHRRLWLVSAMGRDVRPDGWEDLVEEHRTQISEDMAVVRFSASQTPILTDLLTQVPLARVERVEDGKPLRKCTWRNKVHRCNGRAWEDVSVIFAEVGGSPRRCIKLHPYPHNGLVRIIFDEQTLGNSLLVRSGITLEAARRSEGSDATVVVSIDGSERLRWIEPRHGWDWTPHWIDTSDMAGHTARISLDVYAEQEEFRDVCLDGYILSTAVPGEHL